MKSCDEINRRGVYFDGEQLAQVLRSCSRVNRFLGAC